MGSGRVAQLGERRTCTAEVRGSTPLTSTTFLGLGLKGFAFPRALFILRGFVRPTGRANRVSLSSGTSPSFLAHRQFLLRQLREKTDDARTGIAATWSGQKHSGAGRNACPTQSGGEAAGLSGKGNVVRLTHYPHTDDLAPGEFLPYPAYRNGRVAQLGERRTCTAEVRGSTLLTSTIL